MYIINKIQIAIDYIEAHLKEDWKLEKYGTDMNLIRLMSIHGYMKKCCQGDEA